MIRQKSESQNGGNKKTKQVKLSGKRTIFTPWYVYVLFVTNDLKQSSRLHYKACSFAKKNFPYAFFSWNFQSNEYFEHAEQMFREGSERLHSRDSLPKTRKASKYQTFANALQSECSEKNRKIAMKMPMLEPSFSNITIWVYKNKTTPQTFFRNMSWIFLDTAISQNSWVTACNESIFV